MLKMFFKLPNIVLYHVLPGINDLFFQSLKMKASYNARNTVVYIHLLKVKDISLLHSFSLDHIH